MNRNRSRLHSLFALVGMYAALSAATAWSAAPAGFVKQTIQLNAPPVGLAFDSNGVLYALEAAELHSNQATLRAFLPNGTPVGSYPVFSDDPSTFYVGGMTYDPVSDRLLITDNTTEGRLLAVDKAGNQSTLASDIAYIAGVAVRNTGEIVVSTAGGDGTGSVLQVNRTNGNTSVLLPGLDYGAGMAFDAHGDLLVLDADSSSFLGRLTRLPITATANVLTAGAAEPLLDNINASYGVAVDSEGDTYATGAGGLYRILGSPPAETLVYTDGSNAPIAAAIAFDAGTAPFEPFAGPGGGRLAFNADFGYEKNDLFVTLLTPAVPGDYDGNGQVDTADYAVWKSAFGSNNPAADGNRNGVVDAADYSLWRDHVSVPIGSGGLALPASTVPEPPAMHLAALAFVMFFLIRGRVRPTVSVTWRYC